MVDVKWPFRISLGEGQLCFLGIFLAVIIHLGTNYYITEFNKNRFVL